MTVLLSPGEDAEDGVNGDATCTMCGRRAHHPFVHWRCYGDATADLFICQQCARMYARGLIADLIQLSAIAELQIMTQSSVTLQRTNYRDLPHVKNKHDGTSSR